MARFFTKKGMSAYIAKDIIPYEPYIELKKLKQPNFNDYTIKVLPTFDNLSESLKGKEIGILQCVNKDSSLSNNIYFCIRYHNSFIAPRGYLNLKELKIAEPLNFSEKIKDKEFLDLLRAKISAKEWTRQRDQLDYQQYGLLIANHPEGYCKPFNFLNLDMMYHNCKDSTREYPVELEKLNEEEVLFLDEIINELSNSYGKKIDPINSIGDFRILAQEINSHKENSEWGLVRVLFESFESVYARQIEEYHGLLDGRLEILIAEGKVIRLAQDVYKLPKRFSSTINMWEYDKNYKDKVIYTVSALVLDSIGRDVSATWFRDREKLCLGDARIYKYEQAINNAIKDSLYRDEINLHDQETWKSIECNCDGDYQNWYRLYWDEVGIALGKIGINFPEAKAIYGNFENTGTETQATGPRQITDEPAITAVKKRDKAIRQFILEVLKNRCDNKNKLDKLPSQDELLEILKAEYCFNFEPFKNDSHDGREDKMVYFEFCRGSCDVWLGSNNAQKISTDKKSMTNDFKKEVLKFYVKKGLLSPAIWFFKKDETDQYEGFIDPIGSHLREIISWANLRDCLDEECRLNSDLKEKYNNLLNLLKEEAKTKQRK